MKELRKKFERFCLKNRNRGIPNLMLVIAIGNLIAYAVRHRPKPGRLPLSLLLLEQNSARADLAAFHLRVHVSSGRRGLLSASGRGQSLLLLPVWKDVRELLGHLPL